jgi:hypothetical protein
MDFVLNDENVVNDRGFRILNAGIILRRFEDNPVGLLLHEDQSIPISKWSALEIKGSQLSGHCEFDAEDPQAMAIQGKYERQFMNAVSMGLIVLEVSDDPSLMLPGQLLPTVTKCELYEVSHVPIPSNAAAVRLQFADLNVESVFKPIKIKMSMDELKKIAAALGLPDTATSDEICASIAALQSELCEELMGEAEELGLVDDASKEELKALSRTAPGALKLMISRERKARLNAEQSLAEKLKGGGVASVAAAPGRESWGFDAWSKNDPDGLMKMKNEDNARYEALAAADTVAVWKAIRSRR